VNKKGNLQSSLITQYGDTMNYLGYMKVWEYKAQWKLAKWDNL
jgi:hypothetical protein